MPDGIAVTIESTPKRTFASAADWPGWSRSGRTEALALKTLAEAASRYARIVDDAHRRLVASATVADFEVVERTDGSAGTEFGVPSHPSVTDSRPTDAAEAARLAGLVAAAWKEFDRIA